MSYKNEAGENITKEEFNAFIRKAEKDAETLKMKQGFSVEMAMLEMLSSSSSTFIRHPHVLGGQWVIVRTPFEENAEDYRVKGTRYAVFNVATSVKKPKKTTEFKRYFSSGGSSGSGDGNVGWVDDETNVLLAWDGEVKVVGKLGGAAFGSCVLS